MRLGRGRGTPRQRGQSRFGGQQLSRQDFTFGPVQLQREEQVMPTLPAIVAQLLRSGGEIGERRGVGRRRPGALASQQVEFGQLLAFVLVADQRGPAIELSRDLEDRFLALFLGRLRDEKPADPQMGIGARCLRDP